jgi:multiple sugar transport system permease protein
MEKESFKTQTKRIADNRAKLKTQVFPFAMLSPFLIITTIFVVIPIIIMFCLSFTDFNFSMKGSFIGLENYRQIFRYPNMGQILMQTFLFVAVSVVFSVLGSIFIVIITTFYLDIVYKRKKTLFCTVLVANCK